MLKVRGLLLWLGTQGFTQLDSHLLTAVLRMVMTLARIPEGKYSQPLAVIYCTDALAAKSVCLVVRPRLKELAKMDKRLVGVLSIEILLVLCDASEQGR